MIGPEARNSGRDEVFAVLVSTCAAGVADSAAETVAGGDAGELVQAIPAVSQSPIPIIIAGLLINIVITGPT